MGDLFRLWLRKFGWLLLLLLLASNYFIWEWFGNEFLDWGMN